VLSNVIPYGLDQVVLTRLPASRFALLLCLLPATAALVGAVLLRQVPGPSEAVGIALVVAAVFVGARGTS
jgi:inner membrane transporter RhtA